MKKTLKAKIARLVKLAKPYFADYRVEVFSAIGSREVKHIHFAWTQAEALEWCALQCTDDLCIISSSWFGFRVASCNGQFMKVGI